jgi:hypothetical protein
MTNPSGITIGVISLNSMANSRDGHSVNSAMSKTEPFQPLIVQCGWRDGASWGLSSRWAVLI